MADIINVLPDSIANQIAAGEVVQRPASVVKELIENSVDAGATRIVLKVRDGGKEQIQVIDDGIGMSPMDARLCFERHATSKILAASDLEAIVTMGFRGEALASIAAVAEVALATRREDSEMGYQIVMAGSKITSEGVVATAKGTNFTVRNLFFNVPARRRFLKGTSVEMKHVVAEFQRVALANPGIAMQLLHNDEVLYDLRAQNRYHRIVQMFGKRIEEALIPVHVETEEVTIEGYICKPSKARKRGGEQFFFVNGRYMRHPYFHRAVVDSYDKQLPHDMVPIYFLFFTVRPESIDVNIHPTKTEIKFENERILWQIVNSALREALGQFGGLPQLNFHEDVLRDMPLCPPSAPVADFEMPASAPGPARIIIPAARFDSRSGGGDAPMVYPSREPSEEGGGPRLAFRAEELLPPTLPLGHGYFATTHANGLVIVDQQRAHARVLYEQMERNPPNPITSLQLLFPVSVELSPEEAIGVETFIIEAESIGVRCVYSEPSTLVLHALPAGVSVVDYEAFIRELLVEFGEEETSLKTRDARGHLAALAHASAYSRSLTLNAEEMGRLAANLFACREPSRDPDGYPTFQLWGIGQIQKMFQV